MNSALVSPAQQRRTGLGIACGAGAGALWGLVFLAPALVGDFSPLQLTVARYLAYGLIAACLLAPRWDRIRQHIGRSEWLALGQLGLIGNIAYYLLLSMAVQMGGVAMPSLVIGFLPVLVTIIGSRDSGAVPLRKLTLSLLLCIGGALAIGWQAFQVPASGSLGRQLASLACAVGALVAWTSFAVTNSRWLVRLERVSVQDWNLLTGVVTGALSVLFIPPMIFTGVGDHTGADWARFAGVGIGLAVMASIIGNGLWNQMSRLLPLTIVGQMILFETLFALLYGFAWERRLPTTLEVVALALVIGSVVTCLHAHRRGSDLARDLVE